MSAASFKLYGEPHSVSTLPVIMTAVEGGLAYEMVEVTLEKGEHLAPDFRKLNPMHCVPTIDDNGFVLWEARAICKYLCGKYGLPDHFYPKDLQKRAACDMALDFHQGIYYPKITFKVLYPACGWVPKYSEKEMQEAERELNEDIWPAMQRMIEMSGGGPLMGGEKPNLADFQFGVHLLTTIGRCPDSFVAKHAGLTGYLAAIKARCSKWETYMTSHVTDFFSPSGPVSTFHDLPE